MFYRRIAAALLLPIMLGAWTPPAAVLEQPIVIPTEDGASYDTGLTLRQFMSNCGRLFGNGKLEFARRADDGFSMRCAFANPKTGQIFSISEFSPAVLGHHDALKLERFRGPDGIPMTPDQLKEHFDPLHAAATKSPTANSLPLATASAFSRPPSDPCPRPRQGGILRSIDCYFLTHYCADAGLIYRHGARSESRCRRARLLHRTSRRSAFLHRA